MADRLFQPLGAEVVENLGQNDQVPRPIGPVLRDGTALEPRIRNAALPRAADGGRRKVEAEEVLATLRDLFAHHPDGTSDLEPAPVTVPRQQAQAAAILLRLVGTRLVVPRVSLLPVEPVEGVGIAGHDGMKISSADTKWAVSSAGIRKPSGSSSIRSVSCEAWTATARALSSR